MAALKASRQTIEYQAHIDGFRAIAVLLVMVFHTGTFGLNNGFVGVDIFFVISGYLINNSIIKQNVGREWSLWNYAIRRLYRIVPALLVMLMLCLLVFLAIAPPGELLRLARDIPSVALFYSNQIFADSFGYFARPAEYNPLVHTWSLSIEAQLYALFGVLGAFYGPRFFPAAVLICTFASFSYFLVNELNDAYFSLGARFWEFGLGGIVAYMRMHNRGGAGVSAEIGCVLALLGCGFVLALGGEAERKLAIIVTTLCFSAMILFLRSDSWLQRGVFPTTIGLPWHDFLFGFFAASAHLRRMASMVGCYSGYVGVSGADRHHLGAFRSVLPICRASFFAPWNRNAEVGRAELSGAPR